MKRRIALAMLLVVGIVLAVSSSASAVEPNNLYITKSVVDPSPYYTAGDSITYEYVITSDNGFQNISVTDDHCSPVTPVLGIDGIHNIGDDGGTPYSAGRDKNGILNGYYGEAWEFRCTRTLPGNFNPTDDWKNIGTVHAYSAYPNQFGTGEFTATDDFWMERAVLRKNVVLYWEYSHKVLAPGTGDVQFTVDLIKDSVDVGDEVVTQNQPLFLYLMPGSWFIQEQAPPSGYVQVPGRTNWNIGTVPRTPNPRLDTTIFNLAPFDLAITKLGPDLAYGAYPVTFQYEVTNTGMGIVTPVVSDDLCGTPTLVSGDTTAPIGKINPGEVWKYECSYTPDWDAAFPDPLTNTATVSDAEHPDSWTPLYGGDTNTTNNTDTFTLYPFVLRKDVGLYNDGTDPDFGAFADNTTFWVKAFLNGVPKGDPFSISENSPIQLWLTPGTWTFQEFNLPPGYVAFYPNATITFVTGTYPDWTHLNVTWSGCSHGYWKNHTPWPAPYYAGYLISEWVIEWDGAADATFADALDFGGGSGVAGGQQILLKQAVAALLNEAQYGSAFGPYFSTDALRSNVNIALAGSRGGMTSLASTLDYWNNGVCRH